jgi:type IV pilus assembly protein PilQ
LTSGRLTLLDHEESYIGGLYDNDVTIVREGVPILKDLPWWVFGLRYIFGYNSNTSTRKELIVLLKADFVPTLEERTASLSKQQNVLQEKLGEIRKDINNKTTVK